MDILIETRSHLPTLEKTRVRAAVAHFIQHGDSELRIGRHRISITKHGKRYFAINSGLMNQRQGQSIATILGAGENKKELLFEMKTILNEKPVNAKPPIKKTIKKSDNGLAETNAICDFPRETREYFYSLEFEKLQDLIAHDRVNENLNLETGMKLFALCAKLLNHQRYREAMETAIDMLNFIDCSDSYHAICKCAFYAGRHDVFAKYEPNLIKFTIAEFGDKGSRYKDIMDFIKKYGKKINKAA